ncbi:MAG: hypothetical protein NVS1B10_08540 [Candidatus Saccharimonadales bacterium]
MLNLTTTFADSASGLGALGFDGRAFVIQLITFVLAYLVLRKYAFGPILKVLNERREVIETGVKLGEQMKQDKAKLDTEVADLLHKARSEADGIISSAHDSSRQAIREAEEKARLKAASILQAAEAQIITDTARARKKLESEIVDLIADTAGAIIEEKIDAKKDGQLIERALKQRAAA